MTLATELSALLSCKLPAALALDSTLDADDVIDDTSLEMLEVMAPAIVDMMDDASAEIDEAPGAYCPVVSAEVCICPRAVADSATRRMECLICMVKF